MSDYTDVSFMDQEDQSFWDEGQKMEEVSASLVLCTERNNATKEEIKILESLTMNQAVIYKDGVLCIEKIVEEIDSVKSNVWKVTVKGTFTAQDPNGIKFAELNGWNREEPFDATNSISTLEL